MDKLNIQLWSVREKLKEDFSGTLKAISDIGYDGVEFCGYYGGYSGDELRELLDFVGLSAVSCHIPLQDIEDDARFNMHKEILSKIGCMYIVNPFAELTSEKCAAEYGRRLQSAAEKCAINGFMFAHHNHGDEIAAKTADGVSYFDIMMNETDLTLVEFDTYWLKSAGADIEQYLRRYAGRINLLHIKQMKDESTKQISTLIDGIIDFAPVIKTAKMFGTEHFIYENDDTADAIANAKQSIEYFEKLKV